MPRRRSRSQFEETMLPHLDAAYNLARWILRDTHEAEEAVQDSYLRAYEAFAQYRGGSSAAWLLRIVRNTSLTLLRRRKTRNNVIMLKESVDDDEPAMATLHDARAAPDGQLIAKAEQEAVHRALAGLSEIFREVIVLRELDGMSYQEIADITQLPIGTVMSRLSRARRALREALTENGQGHEHNTL